RHVRVDGQHVAATVRRPQRRRGPPGGLDRHARPAGGGGPPGRASPALRKLRRTGSPLKQAREIVLEPVARDDGLGVLELAGRNRGQERGEGRLDNLDVLVLARDAAACRLARGVRYERTGQDNALARSSR